MAAPRREPRGARRGLGSAALWAALGLRLAPAAGDQGNPTTVYNLRHSYGPRGFFDKWDFWTDSDPSNGAVRYVSREEAEDLGMVKEAADHAYFGVEMAKEVTAGTGRPSVRIQSKAAYNSGLFVAKINHAPTGCGTWPAFWMYGDDPRHPWPQWGEYDVVEGIHTKRRAMTTLHTSERCTQESVHAGRDFTGAWEKGTGDAGADNCDVKAPDQFNNQGCSQTTPENSWGEPFNRNGGGTYAAEWDPDAGHIRTWFWPAGSEPGDIQSRLPMPDTWGTPYSYFTLSKDACDAGHFQNMRLVFTLNMCGDLGDAYFGDSCPAAAREMSCRELVEQQPEALRGAFWSIGSLDVYQKPNGHVLPFIFFNDAGHENGGHAAMQSGFLTVLGACAAVMGLAGVALVVRAELSRVNLRDGDGESRRAMVAEDNTHMPRESSGLLDQATQFIQLMFDGAQSQDAPASRLPALSEDFSRQESAGSRLRGLSWASDAGAASAAPSTAAARERGMSGSTAAARDRAMSWDSVATSARLEESDAQSSGWVL